MDGDDLSQDEAEALQPSAKLAQTQNTVFVSVNYRSGVLGFLSLKSLSSRSTTKSSGNYGLGDIVSALNWIKTNIQHFGKLFILKNNTFYAFNILTIVNLGGHPSKVTILARGSGATLVTALTASPKAKDLFQQVWVTNGAGVFQNKSLEMANTENKVKEGRIDTLLFSTLNFFTSKIDLWLFFISVGSMTCEVKKHK